MGHKFRCLNLFLRIFQIVTVITPNKNMITEDFIGVIYFVTSINRANSLNFIKFFIYLFGIFSKLIISSGFVGKQSIFE